MLYNSYLVSSSICKDIFADIMVISCCIVPLSDLFQGFYVKKCQRIPLAVSCWTIFMNDANDILFHYHVIAMALSTMQQYKQSDFECICYEKELSVQRISSANWSCDNVFIFSFNYFDNIVPKCCSEFTFLTLIILYKNNILKSNLLNYWDVYLDTNLDV